MYIYYSVLTSFQINDLSTHLDALWKIAKFYSSEEESEKSVNKSIEELSIAVFHRFPDFITLALNSEDLNVKGYWTTIKTKSQQSQPILSEKTRTPRKRRGSASSISSDDEIIVSKKGLRTPNQREKSKSVVSDVEMAEPKARQDSDENQKSMSIPPPSTSDENQKLMSTPQPSTSRTPTKNNTPSSKKASSKFPKKTHQKSALRKKRLARRIIESSDSEDEDSVIESSKRTQKKTQHKIVSSDESSVDDQPLFSTFDKIKLSK